MKCDKKVNGELRTRTGSRLVRGWTGRGKGEGRQLSLVLVSITIVGGCVVRDPIIKM